MSKKSKLFLSVSEYRNIYFDRLTERKLVDYYDSLTQNRPGTIINMIKYIDDIVPGGAWPGNYGRFQVIDYRLYKVYKGRKKIIISPTEVDYVDSPDMHDLVSYKLNTTEELLASEQKRQKHSLYSIPHRFYNEYSKKLLVTVGGTVCQSSDLTPEMLNEALSRMTPKETAVYLKKIANTNIDLYPSVELPITVRIDGIDDGAIECQFDDDGYKTFVLKLSDLTGGVNRSLMAGYFEFQYTD